jgi:hypothetical protein
VTYPKAGRNYGRWWVNWWGDWIGIAAPSPVYRFPDMKTPHHVDRVYGHVFGRVFRWKKKPFLWQTMGYWREWPVHTGPEVDAYNKKADEEMEEEYKQSGLPSILLEKEE